MKNASLLLLATLVACTPPVPQAPPVAEPTPTPVVIVAPAVVETPAPVAKFSVGQAVNVEGMPANLTATIGEVLGMQPWLNRETQEEVQLMSYLIIVTDGVQTQVMPAPELYLTAK